MAATILTNLAGYTLGVPATETGINVESVDVSSKAGTEIKVPDNIGNTTGLAQFDFEQVYKIKGYLTGAPAHKPGDIIVPANAVVLIGVAAGAVIVSDVDIAYKTKELATLSYTATQRPGIPSTATQVTT